MFRRPVCLREKNLNSKASSKSRRVHDLLPSIIRPSFLSVMLLLAYGCLALWVKNETSNERLIVLENSFRMFPLEVIVKTDGSPENHKITTLKPKTESARHPLNKLQTATVDHERKFDRS